MDSSSITSTTDLESGYEWTEDQEFLMKRWGEEAKGFHWMHHKCRSWFNIWNNLLAIPIIILPIVVGSTFFNPEEMSSTVRIVYGILLIVEAIAIGFQKYMAWGERATLHEEAEFQNQSYADDIEAELSLARRFRTHGLFQKMKERRKTLFEKYPKIIWIYTRAYRKKFGTSRVAMPIITDQIQEIVINPNNNNEPKETSPPSKQATEVIRRENEDPAIQFQMDRFLKSSNPDLAD